MQTFWNERYTAAEYAYGEAPNEWLKEQLSTLRPGRILLPAEGEGRNGVFAATLGWEVNAFDISAAGKDKALKLAQKQGVQIDYFVGSFGDIQYAPESFDAIALIFAHFPPAFRQQWHRQLGQLLRPGGLILLEAFTPRQLVFNTNNPAAGGPRELPLLFTAGMIAEDFEGFEVMLAEETDTVLDEGPFHQGTGAVLRFIAKKP